MVTDVLPTALYITHYREMEISVVSSQQLRCLRICQHIWLSKKKQEELVVKLKQGVTEQHILDEIQDNFGAR